MTRSRSRLACAVALAGLACALGACGDDSEGGSGTPATVSVDRVDGVGDVLVDEAGAALYTPDGEARGGIRCTGECARIWVPLQAGAAAPSAGDDVDGKLATRKRPDGTAQVTYDGRPLYRFSQDPGPGDATGDGVEDEFAGESFTWHAVTPGGTSDQKPRSGGTYGY